MTKGGSIVIDLIGNEAPLIAGLNALQSKARPISVQLTLQGTQAALTEVARLSAGVATLTAELRAVGTVSASAFGLIRGAVGSTNVNLATMNTELNNAVAVINRMTAAWQANGSAARAAQAVPNANARALIGQAGGIGGAAGLNNAALGLSFISPTAGLAAMAVSLGPVVAGLVAAGLAAKTLGDGIEKAATFQRSLQQIKGISGIDTKSMNEFGQYVQKLSTDLPLTTQQLTELGRQAVLVGLHGSEGIKTYTENMAALSIVLRDVDGHSQGVEETGQEIVKVMRSMGATTHDVNEQFAGNVNSLVALKTEFGVQVPLVTALAKFWSSYGHEIGLTTDQVYGWSAALVSVGARAQGAGGSLQKFFQVLSRDASEGADGMTKWAKVMHMSNDEAYNLVRTDPSQFLKNFIAALPNFLRDGKDSTAVMAEFGLKTQQVTRMLTEAATSLPNVTRALAVAKSGMQDTGLAMRTAKEAADNFKDRTIELGNAWDAFKTNIGAQVIPMLTGLMNSITPIAQAIFKLSQDLQGLKAPEEIHAKLKITASDDFTTATLKLLTGGMQGLTGTTTGKLATGAMSTDILKMGLGILPKVAQADELQGQLQQKGLIQTPGSVGGSWNQMLEILGNMVKYQKMLTDYQMKTGVGGRAILGLPSDGSVPNVGPLLPGQARPQPAPTGADIVSLLGMAHRTILNEFNVSGANYHHDGFANPNAVHHGIDYAAPRGTPIYAPFSGSISTREDSKNGKIFELADLAGNKLVGLHLDQFNKDIQAAIIAGGGKALIAKGSQIGTVGNTGAYAGAATHLHLEGWLPDGTKADPRKIAYAGMPVAGGAPVAPPADLGPNIKELQERLSIVQGRMTIAGDTAGKYAGSLREIQTAALAAAHTQQEGSKDWDKAVQVYGSATSALKGLEKGTKEYVATQHDFNLYGQTALDLIKKQEQANLTGNTAQREAARGAIARFQAQGDAQKTVFAAENEAHAQLLSNQAKTEADRIKLAEGAAQERINAAQGNLEDLKRIQSEELANADTAAQKMAVIQKTSTAIYKAELAAAEEVRRKAYAAADKEENPALRLQDRATADAAYERSKKAAAGDQTRALNAARKAEVSEQQAHYRDLGQAATQALEDALQAQKEADDKREKALKESQGITQALRAQDVDKATGHLNALKRLRDDDLKSAGDSVTKQLAVQKQYQSALREGAEAIAQYQYKIDKAAAESGPAQLRDGALTIAKQRRDDALAAARSTEPVITATQKVTDAVVRQRSAYSGIADTLRQSIKDGGLDAEARQKVVKALNEQHDAALKLGILEDKNIVSSRDSVRALLAQSDAIHGGLSGLNADLIFTDGLLDDLDARIESLRDAEQVVSDLRQAAMGAGINPDDQTPDRNRDTTPAPNSRDATGNFLTAIGLGPDAFVEVAKTTLPDALAENTSPEDYAGLGVDILTGLVAGLSDAPGWEKVRDAMQAGLNQAMEARSLTIQAPNVPGIRTGNERGDYAGFGDQADSTPTTDWAKNQSQLGRKAVLDGMKDLNDAQLAEQRAFAESIEDVDLYNAVLTEMKRRTDEAVQSASKLAAIQSQQAHNTLEYQHGIKALTDAQYLDQKAMLDRTDAWQKWQDVVKSNGDVKTATAQLWADLLKIDQDGITARRTMYEGSGPVQPAAEKEWSDNLAAIELKKHADGFKDLSDGELAAALATATLAHNTADYNAILAEQANRVKDVGSELSTFAGYAAQASSIFKKFSGGGDNYASVAMDYIGMNLNAAGKALKGDWAGAIADTIAGLGDIAERLFGMSAAVQAQKKAWSELASAEQAAMGSKSYGGNSILNPYYEKLKKDSDALTQKVNAGFWQRLGWSIFGGAPETLDTAAAEALTKAGNIFNDFASGMYGAMESALLNAFDSGNFDGVAAAVEKSLNQLVAKMYLQTLIAKSQIGADLQQLADDQAAGLDISGDLARLKADNNSVISQFEAGSKGLPGYGAGAADGASGGSPSIIGAGPAAIYGVPEIKFPEAALASFTGFSTAVPVFALGSQRMLDAANLIMSALGPQATARSGTGGLG